MRRFILGFFLAGFILGAQDWTAWAPDRVYRGIQVRERCGGFNEFANAYVWDVQLRNNYPKSIDLVWAVDTQALHGATAQMDRKLSVAPGEIIQARHAVPHDCTSILPVDVNEVRAAGSPGAAPAPVGAPRKFEGRWTSRDPEPFRKQVVFQYSDNVLTGAWSSPGVSIEISAPLPESVFKGISIGPKPPPPPDVPDAPPQQLKLRERK